MSNETELIPHQRLETIAEHVAEAQTEIRQAFALLQQAKNRLHATLGAYHDTVLPPHVSDYDLDRAAGAVAKIVRRNAWRYLFDQMQVWTIMSPQAADRLRKQIEADELPDPSIENIVATTQGMLAQAGDLFNEAIEEVFRYLRPGRWDRHKTNKQYVIGPKVILNSVIHYRYVSEWNDQRLRSLDAVFHRLDGQAAPVYPQGLVCAINDAARQDTTRCETPYFTCKWFGNGNLHLTFRRLDLLKELNRLGGDSAHLPGPERQQAA